MKSHGPESQKSHRLFELIATGSRDEDTTYRFCAGLFRSISQGANGEGGYCGTTRHDRTSRDRGADRRLEIGGIRQPARFRRRRAQCRAWGRPERLGPAREGVEILRFLSRFAFFSLASTHEFSSRAEYSPFTHRAYASNLSVSCPVRTLAPILCWALPHATLSLDRWDLAASVSGSLGYGA